MSEVSLYAPVKKFLESLDFVVKGEIGNCDVVGVREGEPPVVGIEDAVQPRTGAAGG